MKIQVQLFGSFRDLESSGRCQIDYQDGQTAKEIKALVLQALPQASNLDIEALMKLSVVGSEEKLFTDDEPVTGFTSLALLPPVCGG